MENIIGNSLVIIDFTQRKSDLLMGNICLSGDIVAGLQKIADFEMLPLSTVVERIIENKIRDYESKI